MAVLRAFKGIRPRKDLAKDVAALPYDVMNSSEAREMVKDKPYSFLHVDKAEIDLPENINIYDAVVYQKANENLQKMIDQGILIQDDKPKLYIYRLIMNGRAQTGIVGVTSIDDYMNDIIKKHELTREEKEKDRINHVDFCNANTGPIFLTYRNNKRIDEIVKDLTFNPPEYTFVAEDGVAHLVWVIDDKALIEEIVSIFKGVDYLYIADGHHRAASAVKVGMKRREENRNYTGDEEFNYFLSVLFPKDDLYIMDYNRVVKDLNGLSAEDFMDKIQRAFEVTACQDDSPYKPEEKHTFGMFLQGKWFKLKAKPGTYDENDEVNSLDVSILQNNLLAPILGIGDPRLDKRIDFIGGIRGLDELEKRTREDMTVAFSMYPTSIEDLMRIADAKKVMPPKSTWFEPKLRSGLFIHKLK